MFDDMDFAQEAKITMFNMFTFETKVNCIFAALKNQRMSSVFNDF